MAWPEERPRDRTKMSAAGRRIQAAQPSVGQIFKPVTDIVTRPLATVGRAVSESRVGRDFSKQKERTRQLRQPARDAASPLPVGSSSPRFSAPFVGANVSSPPRRVGGVQRIGTVEPIADASNLMDVGENKPIVYTNVGGGLRVGDTPGGLVERSGGLSRIGSTPYDVTDSSLTSAEATRFGRTPVHGGSRARSGPGFGTRPEGGWSPDYDRSGVPRRTEEERMPRFTAPGFTGAAKRARIHSQEQQWLQRRQKAKDVAGLAESGRQGQMNLERLSQAGDIKREGLKAYATASQQEREGERKLERTRLEGEQKLAQIGVTGKTRSDIAEAGRATDLSIAERKRLTDLSIADKRVAAEGKKSSLIAEGRGKITQDQAARGMQSMEKGFADWKLYRPAGEAKVNPRTGQPLTEWEEYLDSTPGLQDQYNLFSKSINTGRADDEASRLLY